MQVMQELALIGLRIQRMPSEPDLEFGIPSQYGYMTVRSRDIAHLPCALFTTRYPTRHYFMES